MPGKGFLVKVMYWLSVQKKKKNETKSFDRPFIVIIIIIIIKGARTEGEGTLLCLH